VVNKVIKFKVKIHELRISMTHCWCLFRTQTCLWTRHPWCVTAELIEILQYSSSVSKIGMLHQILIFVLNQVFMQFNESVQTSCTVRNNWRGTDMTSETSASGSMTTWLGLTLIFTQKIRVTGCHCNYVIGRVNRNPGYCRERRIIWHIQRAKMQGSHRTVWQPPLIKCDVQACGHYIKDVCRFRHFSCALTLTTSVPVTDHPVFNFTHHIPICTQNLPWPL
jgi:hypothetical protein